MTGLHLERTPGNLEGRVEAGEARGREMTGRWREMGGVGTTGALLYQRLARS